MKLNFNKKNIELFSNVSESVIDRIIEMSEMKTYEKGFCLFYDKEKVEKIYIILSGTVSLYKLNENGQKKIIFILGTGKIINDVFFDDLPSSINCEIYETTDILSIGKEYLIEMMKLDFNLCENVIKSLSSKTRRLYRQLKNTPSSVKVEKKLAAKLYKLSLDYGINNEGGTCIDMDLTVTYIADLLGCPRETVSRAMKKLQENNLIDYKNKRVIVYDKDNLAEFFKKS